MSLKLFSLKSKEKKKTKEILTHATILMNLETIILSERNDL